jgi:hypothetical protein
LDLPGRYWKGGKKPVEVEIDGFTHYEFGGKRVRSGDIQYILFKNAYNGSGRVKRDDKIKDYQCIEWKFPMEKMNKICRDLQDQVGDDYVVMVPPNRMCCIIIMGKNYDRIDKYKEDGYKHIREV